MKKRHILAVGGDLYRAPCSIINDWIQAEAKDGWWPLGKTPHVCQPDLRRPWEEIDRIT